MYKNVLFTPSTMVQIKKYAFRHFSKVTSKPIIDLTDPDAKELTKEEFLALSNVETNLEKLKPHQYKKFLVKSNETVKERKDKNMHISHCEPIKLKGNIVKDLETESESKLAYQDRGVYKMNRQDYYKHFFNKNNKGKNTLDKEQQKYYQLLKNPPKIKEKRIGSSKYWYRDDYSPLSSEQIDKLSPNELKFTFMNQARYCRAAKTIDVDTWNLLLERVLKLSKNIKLHTLMRYLQAIGNVQLNPCWRVKHLIDKIYEKRIEMKPKHYVYLFQALSRLRYQGLNLLDDLHEMMLCWSILRNNFLIKAANSLSKLGVGKELLAQPLQKVLSYRIAEFTGSDCIKVKSIACLEMFTDDMLVAFLHKCDYHRTLFCHYTRHLEVIELYLRLLKPQVYERLSEATRDFLQSARKNSIMKNETSEMGYRDYSSDADDASENNMCDEDELLQDLDLEPSGADIAAKEEPNVPLSTQTDDATTSEKKIFNENFVKDVVRLLNLLNITTIKGVIAGPFTLDLYNSQRNLVIECCPPYQYYTQTSNYTTSALWRHTLISAMGFDLILVPYKKWYSFSNDDDKITFLNTLLSNHIA